MLFFTALDFTFPTSHIHTVRPLCLGPAAPFSLELLVMASTLPQQHGGYLPLLGLHLLVSGLFAFEYCSWSSCVLTARTLEWFAIPSSSGPLSVKSLHCDLSILGGPAQHGS